MNDKALIVVDFQHDFIDGTLAVPGASDADFVNTVGDYAGSFEGPVVFTRDWHPADHVSFAAEPEFIDKSWPAHCVRGTDGAEILIPMMPDLILSKGTDREREAYSGFEGDVDLRDWLVRRDVTDVEVVGLALDYCVLATALDAKRNGFNVTVLTDLTLPVAEQSGIAALAQLRSAGAALFDTQGTPR